jgi:thiol-disulfide isomerase/thioredoxin
MNKLWIIGFFFFLAFGQTEAQRRSLQEVMDKPIFVDSTGTISSLTAIIALEKDKIVYVDFWASWCAPCLKAMPDSRNLSERLKNIPITFLYLSIDDDNAAWTSAIARLAMPNNNQRRHYRCSKNDASALFAAFYIYGIPHYMIFDKKGRPVQPQALPPSNKKIEKQLRKMAGK